MTPQAEPATQVPPYSLYDSGGVMIAALFGSPLAAGHLMAINYRSSHIRGRRQANKLLQRDLHRIRLDPRHRDLNHHIPRHRKRRRDLHIHLI